MSINKYLQRIITPKMKTVNDKIAVDIVSVTFQTQFALSCFEIVDLSL